MSSVAISKAYISKLSKTGKEDLKISRPRTSGEKRNGRGRMLFQNYKISVELDVETVRVLVERIAR